jgi:hypothetical protein
MVLTFTTSLCSSFPILPSAIVALLLSAVFAVIMVTANNGQKSMVKCLYGLICTLMIFSAARGGNATAIDISAPSPAPQMQAPDSVIEVGSRMLEWSFIPSAHAGDTNNEDNTKFYFSYWTNGLPAYTNILGRHYIDRSFKLKSPGQSSQPGLFKRWSWTGKE